MTRDYPERGFVARPYSTLEVGQLIANALTVTEAHVVAAAGAFNDPGPNHVNEIAAGAGRFGTRVAHGPLLLGIADGVLGNALGATIVALLEQSGRFRAPVHLGETVIVSFEVAERTDKPAFGGGGIVRFEGKVSDEGGRALVLTTVVLAVAEEPAWTPWQGPAARPRAETSTSEGEAAA